MEQHHKRRLLSFQISHLNLNDDDDPKPQRAPVELAKISIDPSYQAILPPSTGPTTSGTIVFDAVHEFKKGIKCDQTLFPVLLRDTGWRKFHQDFLIEVEAQGTEEILDSNCEPSTPADVQLFTEKQKFMTAVLKRTLMTNKGKSIVTLHANKLDAQTVHQELELHCTKGAHAEADS